MNVLTVAILEIILVQRRPFEPRLVFSWDEDYDTSHVDGRARAGEGCEGFTHALVRRPVGLLALEGAVGDAFAAAALLGRGFRTARADLLSLLGSLCRCHDGGGGENGAAVLLCRLLCGVEVETGRDLGVYVGWQNGGDNKRRHE